MFGEQTIVIELADGLLTPAAKEELPRLRPAEFPSPEIPPRERPPVDHYKVYEALDGIEAPAVGDLIFEDQFGSVGFHLINVRGFAVPVRKDHQGRVWEIENERAHLVIYSIRPEFFRRPKVRTVQSQFGAYDLTFWTRKLLAVPRLKREVRILW